MEQVLPLIVATGWASGVNAYATVALMCVCQRADLLELPAAFARTDVLLVSLALFAIEFVADKVPLVDSTWDVVQTAIRPLVGGTIGALLAGEDGATALVEAGAAGGSGALALASHSAKAGIRLAVNGSPEPFSNVILSLAEDLAVAAVILVATEYPWLAAAVAIVLLTCGVTLALMLARAVRAGLRRLRARRAAGPT
ncbi:MAG TPA: DUF4126 domain-containing protein [Thermoleophilaceae bacterium]|nr:DUF4126 domain-containing protein [Thermoleophilaceae bacterium]